MRRSRNDVALFATSPVAKDEAELEAAEQESIAAESTAITAWNSEYAIRVIHTGDLEPVGYDGFGAPLYAHQIDPRGTE